MEECCLVEMTLLFSVLQMRLASSCEIGCNRGHLHKRA